MTRARAASPAASRVFKRRASERRVSERRAPGTVPGSGKP